MAEDEGERSAKMQLAFCWTWSGLPLHAGLRRLRRAGLEAVEIWPEPLLEHSVAGWKRGLESTGLACAQLCPYFDFMRGAESLAESRAVLRDSLDAARELGCRRLRVFTGPPWGKGVVGARDATSGQWGDAIRGLEEFCDIAAADGVELCLECHEGSLAEDSRSALRLVGAVARSNLTVNLQLPLYQEDWQQSLAALGALTAHVHIHNWTEGLGRGQLTWLDEGRFDWEPVLRQLLVTHGHDVCVSLEHADHGRGDDIWDTADRDGKFLRELRGRILVR